MPAGVIGLILIAALTAFNFLMEDRQEKIENHEITTRYQTPLVLEPEDSPAPSIHPLADPNGIIPAAGEPWPSKPSIDPPDSGHDPAGSGQF